MAALVPDLQIAVAGLACAGFLRALSFSAFANARRGLRAGGGAWAIGEGVILVAIGLAFAAVAAGVVVFVVLEGAWQGVIVFGACAGAGLAALFRPLLPALTPAGRVAMDEVEGTLRYLTVAEADRLGFHAGPGPTPAEFEALLPYAVAPDVDTEWTRRFAAVLAAAAAARGEAEYHPVWYRGDRFSGARLEGLRGAVTSGLRRAATPPASSGGSGGSGRSSGGGGGGW